MAAPEIEGACYFPDQGTDDRVTVISPLSRDNPIWLIADASATEPTPSVSPDWVRISTASAMALRFRSGSLQPRLRLRRHQPVVELRRAAVGPTARTAASPALGPGDYEDKSFIRVDWPLVGTDELVDRMARYESKLTQSVHLDGHPRPGLRRHL